MNLHFKNSDSVKFEVTNITQTPNDYWNSINNIKGDVFQNKGEDFNKIILKSLNYFFLNCVNPSHLTDADWNISFAKSLLDKNNTTGYTTLLTAPGSKNIQVLEGEFYKECFSFIQLAYYINEVDIQGNQFFTYLKYYLNNGIKLPESDYQLDLEYLNKKYEYYSKNKTKPERTIEYWFNGCLFLILNDLGLNTCNFKIVIKNGREYNPIVKVPREFRKYFPFLLDQFDIKSAYPGFIDMIIGSNVADDLYTNISKEYNIKRNEAKVKFNRMLNSGEYYSDDYFTNFFQPIYKEHTPAIVRMVLDMDEPFWKVMQHWENVAINVFKDANKRTNCTRLHDALIIINNDFNIDFKTDFFWSKFEFQPLNEISINLDFSVTKHKPKFSYVSAIPSKIKHKIKTENDSKGGMKFISKSFDIYRDSFNYIKGSFNASYKGKITKEGFIPITESEFIAKCVNCGVIIRDLNPEIEFNGLCAIITEIVENIHINGVYSFNKKSLINIILDAVVDGNIIPLVKTKNWYFKGNKDFDNLDFYEFNKMLNESRLKARMFFLSHKILPTIEKSLRTKQKIYIDLKAIGINDKRDCEVISGIVETFNICNGFDSLRFAKTINNFINKLELCTNFGTLYKDSLYKVPDLVHNLSETALSKEYGINRRTAKKIKDWFQHKQKTNVISEIYYTLQSIANNQKGLEFEIIKDQRNHLSIKKVIEPMEPKALPTISPQDAFFDKEVKTEITPINKNKYVVNISETWNKEPDLKNSVLNIDLERAINMNNDFIVSWFLFNNKTICETDKAMLKNDPSRTAEFVKDIFYNDMPMEWNARTFYDNRKIAS